MNKHRIGLSAFGTLIVAAITVHAAGGPKRSAEDCVEDGECSRGHCYQKQDGKKVCVDCSPSKIDDLRGQVQRFCKDDGERCSRAPNTQEVAEDFFTIPIANAERCIAARKDENDQCWNGGDDGHRKQVEQQERARKTCLEELDTRRGNGGLYTCSDSTYGSRAVDVDAACGSYPTCENWSKDAQVVNCTEIEDAIRAADKCVVAVERIDSDCLPGLSVRRERQFANAKTAYDRCKDILAYKTLNKACK